ncbi:MAG: hypothetical protein LBQ66_05245 [Planctomycetaceae bacterium]|nr:hypothetical protein [Planctomycetaceae bacterium]
MQDYTERYERFFWRIQIAFNAVFRQENLPNDVSWVIWCDDKKITI